MLKKVLTIGLALLTLASNVSAVTEERSIETRPGVKLEFLFMTPEGGGPTRDALILFPGGNGMRPYRLLDGGTVQGWNFLVRSAVEFSQRGFALVTVNPPSDHPTGMSTGFRESPEHAEDVGQLAGYLASLGYERIFLVGNSRGTLSAASLAGRLEDSRISGVILTSSLEYEEFMRWLPLNKIRRPVLMVHNREDACRVSAFVEAQRTRDTLKSYTRVDFVEVDNGGTPPMSGPCDNLSTHGFFGVEEKVVQVIADWISGRKVPDRIE